MSLSEFSKDLLELVTLTTHAPQKFVSSSLGVTGSVPLLAKSSDSIKNVDILSSSLGTFIDDDPANLDPMQRASLPILLYPLFHYHAYHAVIVVSFYAPYI